jgi:hypothetical protein
MAMTLDGSNGVTFNDASLQGAAASPFGLKNRIINGAMVIDQRYAGASISTSTIGANYTLDRWFYYVSTGSKFTVQQNQGSVTPPTGFSNYLGVTSSSAYTPTGADNFFIAQNIEANNVSDLAWGTANAKTITISFWVRSSLTGNFGLVVQNAPSYNYSYPILYTINSANTWEQKTITIPAPTAGTWATSGSGIGMALIFSVGIGTTYAGTSGAWTASNANGVTGQTNVVATNGATFYITGVQLEIGSTATPFERRLYGQELNNCKRYYEKSYDYSVVPATTTNVGRWNAGGSATGQTTGFISGGHVVFQVEKRAIPTVTSYDAVGNSGKCTRFTLGTADNNNQGVSVVDVAMNGWFPYANSGGTNDSGCGVHWVASAEL